MDIGQMRHRVTIRRGILRKNKRLEEVYYYYKWRTIWAGIFPEDGRVFYRAKQENSEVEGVLRIRWQPGLLDLARKYPLRIDFKNRRFEVLWIRDVEESRKEMRVAYREVQL